MNSKFFYLISLGVLSAFIFSGCSISKLSVTNQEKNVESNQQSTNVLYSSTKFGFMMSYQADSKIHYDSEAEGGAKKEPYKYLLTLSNDNLAKNDADGSLYFNLEIYDTAPTNCTDDWSKKKTIKNLVQKDVVVGGISTKLVNFTGAYDLDYSTVCFQKNGLFYDINSQGSTKTDLKVIRDKYFQDVLSSFKFVN